MIPLPPVLEPLIDALRSASIRPVLVGGFVRDYFISRQTRDIDIELYGVTSLETLEALLGSFGKVNLVGKSFGVLKLAFEGYHLDFSPPRSESKRGFGHKGFEVHWHRQITYEEAARRRDFTINAIGYDPIERKILDPFGGVADLKERRLRCVDPETFRDDPLRILRAVQFTARFGLTCDNTLLALCRTMVEEGALEELPKERIFEELRKLLLKSERPSIGLSLLEEMGALPFFAPLDQLSKTPQDRTSHPEGDVWTHTLMAVDTMASMKRGEERSDLVLILAILLHDIAKPVTTVIENGALNAPRHAEEGEEMARLWLSKLTDDKKLVAAVLPLVRYHGWPRKLHRAGASDAEILRLSTRVCIDDLVRVAEADFFGRTFIATRPETFEAGNRLRERARALGVLYAPPEPLLMGRDLVDAGLKPSEAFGTLLARAYEAQLDRTLQTRTDALEWLRTIVTQL